MPSEPIAGLVLAAGLSIRMGRPKMILPWKNSTVIRTVVTTLEEGGAAEVFVVTGGADEEVIDCLKGMTVQRVFNPSYTNGEMLDSIQVGLAAIPLQFDAVMVALGDQPQMESMTVEVLVEAYRHYPANIFLPSYQMRRGHPWLLRRAVWAQIFALRHPQTMRDFFKMLASEIHYVVVETPSILEDLDTPEDYQKSISNLPSNSRKGEGKSR